MHAVGAVAFFVGAALLVLVRSHSTPLDIALCGVAL